MKIKSILNNVDNSNAAMLLESEWNDLTFTQKDQINLIERELSPIFAQLSKQLLTERELTIDEIEAIFDKAVTRANDEGNRTSLGKTKDLVALPITAAKMLDNKINDLGKTIQNSEPVKDFDNKFDKLKGDIVSKNGDKKVVRMLQFLSDKAKEHPTATVLIIGVLTAAAAVLTGPAGGAAAGFITNAIGKLLQGEKLSTAVGTSAKTAIYGYLAGLAFKWVSKEILENIAMADFAELEAMEKSMQQANEAAVKADALAKNPELAKFLGMDNINNLKMSGNINNFHYNYDVFLTPESTMRFENLQQAVSATETFSKDYYTQVSKMHEFLSNLQNGPDQNAMRASFDVLDQMAEAGKHLSAEQLSKYVGLADKMDDKILLLGKASEFIGGIIQASVQQAGIIKKNMHKSKPAEKPAEEEIAKESLENNDDIMNEGIFSSAVEKIKNAGKNITQIVTKDKLDKAWKKAGSPTDSNEIKKILSIYFSKNITDELLISDSDPLNIKKLNDLSDEIKFHDESLGIIEYLKNKITA